VGQKIGQAGDTTLKQRRERQRVDNTCVSQYRVTSKKINYVLHLHGLEDPLDALEARDIPGHDGQ
jgi:hypothetical protein